MRQKVIGLEISCIFVSIIIIFNKTVNMFKDYRIKLVNDHIVIDDEQHLILDTGSPTSFHSSGVINLSGEDISVGTSIVGVCSYYLSSNVGTSINGLVGMDIIHRYSLLVDARCGYLFIDDDAVYSRSFKSFDLGPLAQGLIAIEMRVNNIPVRMIVDTGAPVSYIKESIVKGLVSNGEVNDFHPFMGDFKTETYQCVVDSVVDGKQYNQTFGVLPNLLSMTLAMLQVDGIIGVDLFKRYRIQIRDGKLFLPPQGI